MRPVLALLLAALLQLHDDGLGDWRRRSDRGSHYEGPVTEPVGAPVFELLSFTRSISASFPTQSNIRLRYYSPPGKDVIIVARGLKDHRYYRMETKVPSKTTMPPTHSWREFTGWSFRPFLDRLRIEPRQLGYVAFVAEGRRLTSLNHAQIVPLEVLSDREPAPPKTYDVWLRSNVSLHSVTTKLLGESSRVEIPVDSPRETVQDEPFQVKISLLDMSPGPYALVIEGSRETSPPTIERQKVVILHALAGATPQH